MSQSSDKIEAGGRRDTPGHLAHRCRVAARLATLEEAARVLPRHGGPCTLEIGCGHGHFLADYAEANPEREFIGIDLIGRRLGRANTKADKRGLRNVTFLKAEGVELLESAPPELVFNQIFMIFPDPWPKKRHYRRRLVQNRFLTLLAARSGPGARFYFRTDFEPYFAWTEEKIGGHPDWVLRPGEEWPFESESYFQRILGAHQSLVAERVKENRQV